MLFPMTNLLKNKLQNYWFVLGLVMLILLVPGYFIIEHDKEISLGNSTKLIQQELSLLSTLTGKLLQSGEYDAIQPVFDKWSVNYPETQSISLTTSNGYNISEFANQVSALHTHTENVIIEYGYRGSVRLSLKKNIDSIYTQTQTKKLFGFGLWIFLGLFGTYIVRNLQIHQWENARLEQLGQSLSDSNEKLKKEQSLLRSLIDSIPDLIFFKDKNSVYMGCNKAFEEFSNCKEKEQIGKTDFDFLDEETARLFRNNDQLMMQSGDLRRNEEWVTYPDGHKVLLDTLKTPYYDVDGNILGLIGISRNITEIKRFQEQLEELAYHDVLTKLPNRRLLLDQMQISIAHACRYNSKIAICTLDLDGFKNINDTHGHAIGDMVLVEFANRLMNSLRSEDTGSRWGGDEFTFLFTDLKNINECIEIVERLQNLIAVPFEIKNNSFTLSASIGLTVYPDDKSDADTLLRHADQAMYEAKLAGKNRFQLFDLEQNTLLHNYCENRARVEYAIENNELVLYYQPQIHLKNGAPYGVEALVRWNHPKKGILPPGQFLPFVEEHALNIKLDWWVLNNAIAQLQEWLKKGVFFHLSINVSATSFQQVDFIDKLQELFRCYDKVEPQMISLEILESVALGNLDRIAAKMKKCQALGLQFSLDDFGTGYSSLTYLSKLPADNLKIDQSFIRDMLIDEGDASIVEGIIRLSSAFNRMVIAEGVEEILHGIKLIEMGCFYAQGYAIAKPMPADNLIEWLNHFKAPAEWLKTRHPVLSVLQGGNGKNI